MGGVCCDGYEGFVDVGGASLEGWKIDDPLLAIGVRWCDVAAKGDVRGLGPVVATGLTKWHSVHTTLWVCGCRRAAHRVL